MVNLTTLSVCSPLQITTGKFRSICRQAFSLSAVDRACSAYAPWTQMASLVIAHRSRRVFAEEAAHAPSAPPDHVVWSSASVVAAAVPCVTRYVVWRLRRVSFTFSAFSRFVFFFLLIINFFAFHGMA